MPFAPLLSLGRTFVIEVGNKERWMRNNEWYGCGPTFDVYMCRMVWWWWHCWRRGHGNGSIIVWAWRWWFEMIQLFSPRSVAYNIGVRCSSTWRLSIRYWPTYCKEQQIVCKGLGNPLHWATSMAANQLRWAARWTMLPPWPGSLLRQATQ